MYKTAIAHVEGQLSYDEALNNFKTAYPEYEVRGVKQSNFGWIAFIQKEAYQDQNVQDGVPAEMDELPSPGADVEMMEVEMGEGPEETYGEEEEKQEGLMEELEAALETVERLVEEIKDSEEDEEEVRPFDTPEEVDDELDLEMEEGFEKELPMTLEREKEAGVTFASATKEVQELLKDKEYKGYRLASVEEKEKSFVAKLLKKKSKDIVDEIWGGFSAANNIRSIKSELENLKGVSDDEPYGYGEFATVGDWKKHLMAELKKNMEIAKSYGVKEID